MYSLEELQGTAEPNQLVIDDQDVSASVHTCWNRSVAWYIDVQGIWRLDWLGNGGGSVGREVAYDTRDPQFKSQHWQSFIYQL